jgi:hypothetical protein
VREPGLVRPRLVRLLTPLTMQREGAGSQSTAGLAANSHPVTLLPGRGRPLVGRARQRGDLPQRTSELPQAFAGDGGRVRVGLLALDALQLDLDEDQKLASQDLGRALRRGGLQLGNFRRSAPLAELAREVTD